MARVEKRLEENISLLSEYFFVAAGEEENSASCLQTPPFYDIIFFVISQLFSRILKPVSAFFANNYAFLCVGIGNPYLVGEKRAVKVNGVPRDGEHLDAAFGVEVVEAHLAQNGDSQRSGSKKTIRFKFHMRTRGNVTHCSSKSSSVGSNLIGLPRTEILLPSSPSYLEKNDEYVNENIEKTRLFTQRTVVQIIVSSKHPALFLSARTASYYLAVHKKYF